MEGCRALTWHGHVVFHLEECFVVALAQRGQCSRVAGSMQWDPVHTQQPVSCFQGALPGGKARSAGGGRPGQLGHEDWRRGMGQEQGKGKGWCHELRDAEGMNSFEPLNK